MQNLTFRHKCALLLCGLCSAFSITYGQMLTTQLGQQMTPRVITPAVPFLMIAPDARAGAMGETGVAVADDANAMHWNPSALGFLDNRAGVAFSYTPWLRTLGIPDIKLVYLSGYFNTGKGVIGSSLRYFNFGDVDLGDHPWNPIGYKHRFEFALDVAYAVKVTPALSSAISLRFFNSRVSAAGDVVGDAKPVNSVAGDISFVYKKDFEIRNTGRGIRFSSGMNLSNIGPKVSYTSAISSQDFIPVNLRLGYAFKFMVNDRNHVVFTNDFNKLLVPSEGGRSDLPLLDGMFGSFGDALGRVNAQGVPLGEGVFGEEISEIQTSVGIEYWHRGTFAARGGYFYEDPQKGARQFFSFGGGIRYKAFGFDFSYLVPVKSNNPLQNTLRLSLSYNPQPKN
jgi:hypothetical protein